METVDFRQFYLACMTMQYTPGKKVFKRDTSRNVLYSQSSSMAHPPTKGGSPLIVEQNMTVSPPKKPALNRRKSSTTFNVTMIASNMIRALRPPSLSLLG